MSQFLRIDHINRIVVLSLSIAVAASVATAQRKKSKLAPPATSNTPVQPQLLNADKAPTLRFPIARASLTVSSLSYGWLDVTKGAIHYSVVEPSKKLADGFSVTMAEIRDLKLNPHSNTVTFRAGDKKQDVFYMAQENWGNIRSGRDFFARIAEGSSGTESILKALSDFEAELALVKSTAAPPAPVTVAPAVPATPAPAPVAPPSPPMIVVSMPSGAGMDQTVELSESSVVIRGVAMDSTGIPVVRINGSPASMRPQTTQAAEFWSEPLPLRPGANPVQITASNSAHLEAKLAFTVHYTARAGPVNPKGLEKAEIISLLAGAVPASRVTEIVKERGVKFAPTADDLNEIRGVGGSDELIQAIQKASSPR